MPHLNLRTKILLAMALIALLVAGAITATDYHFRRQELLTEFQTFVPSVAGPCALAIPAQDVSAIRASADAAPAPFPRPRAVLARVREINPPAENEISLLRPTRPEDDPF